MNVAEYTNLINKPDAVNDKQTEALGKIIQEFPYFQSARALYLKGLYNQNSFKYNYALKIAAAHTTDRSVLFDFITSDTFTTIQKGLYEQKAAEILDITVAESEVVSDDPKLTVRENTVEQSILTSIKEASSTVIENKEEDKIVTDVIQNDASPELDVQEKLEIGKPLAFSLTERHSFQEWLQLSKFQPINREIVENPLEKEKSSEVNFEKQKKNVLIDKFIETNPKISPVKKDSDIPTIFFEPSNADNSSLMTETLARVYLEQKKYQKAIQAYEILILKYPEKSSFFADRILDIKNLQQNNT
jgi:tetratricopeptide (TPR) repeat protein